ncbi:MAG: hypothetical protein IPH96_03545 [Saprospiraceae bacterium]|nr:hypothetical protein [Saprospiraceae bacterium]
MNSQSTWIETNGPMTLTLSAFTLSSDGVWVASATSQGVFFQLIKEKLGQNDLLGFTEKIAMPPVLAQVQMELFML